MRDRDGRGREAPPVSVEETIERVGDLEVSQPATGYRYGLDPFLLASFIAPKRGERIVDIGTGCGIIPLLLASRHRDIEMTCVELQSHLAAMAAANMKRNGLAERCHVIEGDIRDQDLVSRLATCDRVVSNPPFRSLRSGRVCPESSRALARHEIALSMADLCAAAAALLRPGGAFSFIHLPERLGDIFTSLAAAGLEAKEMRFVHSFAGSAPELVLMAARRGKRRGIRHYPPLVIYERQGVYSAEAEALLYGPPPP